MTDDSNPYVPLLFLAVFSWMFLSGLTPIQTNDIWWHLATGRYIAGHHALPRTDIFSFTCAGHPWINTYWLFDLAVYLAYALAGLSGVIVAKSMLVLLVMILLKRGLHRLDVAWTWQWPMLMLAFLAAHPRGYGYLENASLVTLAFLTLLLSDLMRATRRRTVKDLYHWPILFVLWANLHRGFILGLAIAGLWCALESIRSRDEFFKRWGGYGMCWVATLCTPFTTRSYAMIRADYSQSAIHVAGWQHTPFAHLEAYWFLLALFIGVAAGQSLRKEKISWSLMGIGAFLAWGSVRYVFNTPYFVIFATLYTAERLSAWTAPAFFRSPRWNYTWLAAGLLSSLSLAALVHVKGGVNRRVLPVEACDFIERENIMGRFYEDYGFGGYWIWRFAPQRPVFIDGRYPAVAGYDRLLEAIESARRDTPPRWNAFLDQWGVEAALLNYPTGQVQASIYEHYFPKEQWALVYWDDVSLVFLKRLDKYQKIIRQTEFVSITPDLPPDVFLDRLRSGDVSAEKARLELTRNLQLHPESRRTAMFLSVLNSPPVAEKPRVN